MDEVATTSGRPRFDIPSPIEGVPWLVYPSSTSNRDRQRFYCIVDGTAEERLNYHFRHSSCKASAYGWILLSNFGSEKMYLFNPWSSQRCPLPRLIDNYPTQFFILSNPGKDDCFIVGVYFTEQDKTSFVYTSPRGKSWNEHKLDIDGCCILSAASDNGKVYLLTSRYVLVVIQFSPLPSVQYLKTKLGDKSILWTWCGVYDNLVASGEDLYSVETVTFLNLKRDIVRTMVVSKLDFSSMTWVDAETLDGYVFLISGRASSSFLATGSKLKGNCIYFADYYVLYCFNLEYRSLRTAYSSFETRLHSCKPLWLSPDDSEINHVQEEKHLIEESRILASSYEKFCFDCSKFVSSATVRTGSIIKQSTFCPRWHPRTPWLMFTHKNDGKYKLLDPSSKIAYELVVPELSNSVIYGSIDGWLFAHVEAVDADSFPPQLIINPFSNQTINLPLIPPWICPFGVAFSAPPTNPECIVFCISQMMERSQNVTISICHPGDEKWTTRSFQNNIPFQLAHHNAVYLNDCFYCLAMNGYLGVFDPTNSSWRVLGAPVDINREASYCTLVKTCGTLLSVFIDLFRRPIGMFEFDSNICRWERVTDMRDRTFFFGEKASFCATAHNESMRNMIYFSNFEKECSLDLVKHCLSSIGNVSNSSMNAKIGYIHCWIDPNTEFLHGLDHITGNVSVL